MMNHFDSAADAEDAYYDAIDESDTEKLMSVWEDSSEVGCLLPMQPMCSGREAIESLWRPMLDPDMGVDIMINHLQWIESGDIAIHVIEERITLRGDGGAGTQPPIYAVNTFRRSGDGWRLLIHVNSPAPPPPGAMAPGRMHG